MVAGDHSRPQLPESSPGYLQPNSPQPVKWYGWQDRCGSAGGEVQPGSVTATNLYQPGFLLGGMTPTPKPWTAWAEPITDMAFLQDSAYLFKRGGFLISSEGPDDYGQNGQWQQPRQIAQRWLTFLWYGPATESKVSFSLRASGLS